MIECSKGPIRFEDSTMTREQLRATLQASPFQPFNIRMADGRVFHVPHPDYLSFFPSGPLANVYNVNGRTSSIVDLLLMTELEIPAEKPA
jgi:hypothetical protein